LRLSLRITVAFAVGGLLVSTAVALSAYLFTYHFLVRQQEHDALRQSYLGAAIVRDRLRTGETDVPEILDSLAPDTTSVPAEAVVYADNRWFSSSLLVSRDTLPQSLRTTVLGGSAALMWTRVGATDQVVVALPIPAVGAAYFNVIDESSLARTLATLRSILLTAASATTAAGAALGWWASRRLTRPLRAVTTASAEIGAGRLDTRLGEEDDADLSGLVHSFNAMADSLRDRLERDARFTADVSHELRSPLTTLRTSLAVLEGRRDELSERGRSALDLVAGEIGRFDRLVEDLLEISRFDADAAAVDLEPVRICELVLNLLSQPEYDGVPADADAAALGALVLGDKRRLEQVLRNLLDNARIHAGGAVCVAVHRATPDRVRLVVEDAGPGVPAADRMRIFERFARGSNARRRGSGGGSGLGLALVSEHVRALGGRVELTDRPGGGSCFAVDLPVAPP
jgi:signal transduction histidine kinase